MIKIGFPKPKKKMPSYNLYKRHKYNAKRTMVGEHSFPSQLHANTFVVLKMWEKGGLIKDIEMEYSVELSAAKIRWKVDFRVFHLGFNQHVFYEPKGMETSDYRIKFKLFGSYGPAPLYIVKAVKNYSFTISNTALPPRGIFTGERSPLVK